MQPTIGRSREIIGWLFSVPTLLCLPPFLIALGIFGSFRRWNSRIKSDRTHFQDLRQLIHNLETTRDNQTQQLDSYFESLSARLDTLEIAQRDSTARSDIVEKSLNGRIDDVSTSLADATKELSGQKAIKMTNLSRVAISYPINATSTQLGCGTLVLMDGYPYVASAGHVFDHFPAHDPAALTTMNLTMHDGSPLNLTRPPLTFQGFSTELSFFDLALLPVQSESFQLPWAQEVSRLPIPIGTPLFGMSSQPDQVVLQYCRTLEALPDYMQADCGGAKGFSGTGYGDPSGVLVAVHLGSDNYRHAAGAETSETSEKVSLPSPGTPGELVREWNQTKRKCHFSSPCASHLFSTIELASRNPRMQVGEAYHLWKLFEKDAENRTGSETPSIRSDDGSGEASGPSEESTVDTGDL
jgi:hypothetical protein